jgi:hypothetical protein
MMLVIECCREVRGIAIAQPHTKSPPLRCERADINVRKRCKPHMIVIFLLPHHGGGIMEWRSSVSVAGLENTHNKRKEVA